jgi:hypothetical protein
MEIQLTLPQMRCLATLAKAAHGEQCFMGGGKRVHVLNACRALVRRGLAIEFNNVYFIASALGRAEFARRNNSQPTLVDSNTESPPIFDSIIALNKELAKPKQVPLTEEQVFHLIEANTKWMPAAGHWRLNEVEFARAIEAAHGITGGKP